MDGRRSERRNEMRLCDLVRRKQQQADFDDIQNDRAEALEPFLCSEGGRQFKKHKPLEKRSPFNLFLGSQKKYKTPILFIASISPQPVEKKINIHLDNLI
jgi:hypothetical protein